MSAEQLARLGIEDRLDEALIYATRAAEGLRTSLTPAPRFVRNSERLRQELMADIKRLAAKKEGNQ